MLVLSFNRGGKNLLLSTRTVCLLIIDFSFCVGLEYTTPPYILVPLTCFKHFFLFRKKRKYLLTKRIEEIKDFISRNWFGWNECIYERKKQECHSVKEIRTAGIFQHHFLSFSVVFNANFIKSSQWAFGNGTMVNFWSNEHAMAFNFPNGFSRYYEFVS